ncbi:MAG: S24/S26 family peptidase [Merdibacter sp.]
MGINTEQTKTTQIPEVTRRRIVDIHTYLPVLIDIIKSGKDVSVTVTGSSMAPFLAHLRDSIIVSPPPRQFHRGDMVFFQRQDSSYVMHRIHHLKEGKLYLVGDNQTEIEGPIDPEQVFGIVRKVIRNGKLLQKGDFWWDFFEKAWIRIVPLRSAAVKAVSIVYKLRNRQKR